MRLTINDKSYTARISGDSSKKYNSDYPYLQLLANIKKKPLIFNWKIPYENTLDKMSNKELSDFLMKYFGVNNSEIKIENDYIEGTPSALTLTNWITGIRICVYDIILTNDKQKKILTIKIRLFKILVISLLFLLPLLIDSADFWLIGLLGYFGSVVFFGTIATIELYSAKSGIEKKIKNVYQQSLRKHGATRTNS